MKKKSLILTTLSIVTLTAISALFSSGVFTNSNKTYADNLSYGISFNSTKNKFHSYTGNAAYNGEATIQTNLGNDIKFSYYQFKGTDSSWHVLGDSGYFYNVDPIHGIKNISLSFKTNNANFSIYYSGGNLFDQHQSFISSTSKITSFDFNGYKPNYFKVVNESGTDLNISEINITLSCEDNHSTLNGAVPMISEDKKTITYGLYPQTHVSDANLITELNKLGASAISANQWYFYQNNYYAKVVAQPFYYSLTYSDGYPVIENEIAWFKCEPIVWRILSNDNGYLIMSEMTLDKMYYTTHESSYDDENGKYVSISNYYHSDVRSWLNEDFFNSAFALNNEYVLTTAVDNSYETCNGKNTWNDSPDTEDKVFLPSYKDMKTFAYGFPSNESESELRTSKATDYAMAKCLYAYEGAAYLHNSIYWTRSPVSENRAYVSTIKWNGAVDSEHATKNYGVRPCITLDSNL